MRKNGLPAVDDTAHLPAGKVGLRMSPSGLV